ncbi:uncharacterized protein BXZ73DRAFT_51396 [Epithele typhae]|uniref:uncharacterized protein n=1 Tax=Epithele typhae TaxID=378194 RepID=UPI002007C8C1|nr:uncharacterized protein BXZ73DRAFT_51396 [Epithele typhae]KAH9922319.1 hypothetical protein BXZ73DRAFT_51396 [Epithele typhae]
MTVRSGANSSSTGGTSRSNSLLKLSANDVLNGLIATTSAAKEVADLCQFTPVKAAASLLLLIFETIKASRTQQEDCLRLARRCLSLLVDIRDHLPEEGDLAPASLLKALSKFERTLDSIYTFVRQAAEQNWRSRLMRKSSIENALAEYNAALDDAARSFQIATLINIHLAVGERNQIVARRASTLPPYTVDADTSEKSVMQITTNRELVTSPTSHTVRQISSPQSSVSVPTREPSIDLIDLSSPKDSEYFLNVIPSSNQTIDFFDDPEVEEPVILDHHGFSRYHQSQFRLKGKSRTIKDGWWAGAMEGEIGGQKALMLRYEGGTKSAAKKWVRDVKLLQNVYHPNLPQMIGYSDDETPTPFILLANVQTRLPQALLLDSLRRATLTGCAQLLLRLYRDTLDAALYLQQQLQLSDAKLQDYIEARISPYANFRIDMDETVVMGLPPPEVDQIVSWRNFGVAYSVRDVYLKILPNRGLMAKAPSSSKTQDIPSEIQHKLNHLTILARALLPDSGDTVAVQERLHRILGSADCEDEDEDAFEILHTPTLTLRRIREAAISAGGHKQVWSESNGIAPHRFAVGDYGYFPKSNVVEQDWSEFVVLGNVQDEGLVRFETTHVSDGKQGAWHDGCHKWDDVQSFELPDGVHGWTVVVLPEAELSMHVVHTTEVVRAEDAWSFLLIHGSALGRKHNVAPEELILITRTGSDQQLRVRDIRRVQYWPSSHNPPRTGSFGHQSYSPFAKEGKQVVPGQDLAPKVFYLFTSGQKGHEPFFTQTPIPKPPPPGEKHPDLDPGSARCFASLDTAYGFLNYVQLHPEDFLN